MTGGTGRGNAHQPRLVVPFYVNPVAGPQAWADLARSVGRIDRAVVNVHDGPGALPDATYVPALAGVPRGIGLVGYVSTRWGRRSDDLVRRDARLWRVRYGIAAVMLDEVTTDPAEHDRLVHLVEHLRADGATEVLGNPGTLPSVLELLEVFDRTCVFEGTCADYLPWTGEVVAHLAERTWHLVHSCSARHARSIAGLARDRGAGSVWVSTEPLPHPWTGLTKELLACPVPSP